MFGHSRHYLPVHVPKKFEPSEEAALYITHAIRAFANATLGIFVPIYIFQLEGKRLLHEDLFVSNVAWILAYLALQHLSFLIVQVLSTNLVFLRLKFRYSILLSGVLLALWQIALVLAQDSYWYLVPAAFFAGATVFFYWIPYHIFFLRKLDHGGHFGKETSFRFFVVHVMNALGPVVGGLTIAWFGFNPLFVIALVLMIASAVPVFMEVHEGVHHEHKVAAVFDNYFFSKTYWRTTLAFFGRGFEDLIYVALWPILLFIVLRDFAVIGLLTGLTVLVSSTIVLVLGRLIDRYDSSKIQSAGVVFVTLFYVARAFLKTPYAVYLVDLVDRITGLLYALPFETMTYEKARSDRDADFMLYREIPLHTGFFMGSIVCLLLLLAVPQWQYLFFLGIGGALLTLFIQRK